MLFKRLRALENQFKDLQNTVWRNQDWQEAARLRRENEELKKKLEKLETKLESN